MQVSSQLLISQTQLGIAISGVMFMDLMLHHEERNVNYSSAEQSVYDMQSRKHFALPQPSQRRAAQPARRSAFGRCPTTARSDNEDPNPTTQQQCHNHSLATALTLLVSAFHHSTAYFPRAFRAAASLVSCSGLLFEGRDRELLYSQNTRQAPEHSEPYSASKRPGNFGRDTAGAATLPPSPSRCLLACPGQTIPGPSPPSGSAKRALEALRCPPITCPPSDRLVTL